MSRWEHRKMFEAIVALRARYATLGPEDRESVISIEAAIAEASAQLAALPPGPPLPPAPPAEPATPDRPE